MMILKRTNNMMKLGIACLLILLGSGYSLILPRYMNKLKPTCRPPPSVLSNFKTASSTITPPPSLPSIKNDSKMETFMIFQLSRAFAALVPDKSIVAALVHKNMCYGEFVDLTKSMLKLKAIEDIPSLIVGLLKSIIPLPIRQVFTSFAKVNTKWLCELSSMGMSLGFLKWLVGGTERFAVKIPQADGQEVAWASGVKLTKCKYLETAGCKSACLYLCKAPTEMFFNDELGVPVYMKPNFEDQSCELHFGIAPPPVSEDPAYQEKCYKACPSLKALSSARAAKNSSP